MNVEIKQISSLEKVLPKNFMDCVEISEARLLGGERFSYQIAIRCEESVDERYLITPKIDSLLKEHITIYSVKNIPADLPISPVAEDKDYLVTEPAFLPDLLVPLSEQKHKTILNLCGDLRVFWIEVAVPDGYPSGVVPITIQLSAEDYDGEKQFAVSKTIQAEILSKELPEQSTVFTQWVHVDCIASAHHVPIYSQEHWELIEKYMSLASELGINMILTPVFTPALDTARGSCRPCTQLVKIEKRKGEYFFNFSLLSKWISLCKKCGIKYFEISHFFSQWGAEYAPNIFVTEDGEEKLLFGWHTKADGAEYTAFLKAFIPSLLAFLQEEQVLQLCSFHISDEPSDKHLEAYQKAVAIVKPLLGECRIMDALSNVEFYEHGLVDHPVCGINHIHNFIDKKIENIWAYHCCAEHTKVSNRFMAMPSYRNRIIGLQLYKYGIPGFLQWGYNFYYSQLSLYEINPYVTTSSDGVFSSGDPFSVYPGTYGPLPSLRAFVFRDALQDIEVCRLLEQYIGKKAVVALIEKEAGMELTFFEYPRNAEFIQRVMYKIKGLIRDYENENNKGGDYA